ncbi:MAG: hypothetical protein MZV49_27265 [Rhodopseudomonas palustris]|nr:hypothetical protein [Rhodopseudomonas palustris]
MWSVASSSLTMSANLASAQASALLGATHALMADRSLSALQTFFIQSSSLIAEGTIEEAVLGSIQELKSATGLRSRVAAKSMSPALRAVPIRRLAR